MMIGLYIRELDIKGGTHKQFLHLLKYLDSHAVSFKVITTRVSYADTYEEFKYFDDRIKCLRKPTSNSFFGKLFRNLVFIKDLRKELRGIRKLNIHDNGLQYLLPFLIDKYIVWQINDLPSEFVVGVNRGQKVSLIDRLKSLYVKASAQMFVNKVTVNVRKNKDRVKERMNLNAEILYCGIEKVLVRRDQNDVSNRLSKKTINLLSSGVFFPYRNYETQVEVVDVLLKKGYDVSLSIIGSLELNKEYASKILNLIKAKKLDSHIRVEGQVSEERFRELHVNNDIFLFVNIDQSWGLAVFEAMSCGIPVIVSESVGATEILTRDHDAMFVDPLDAMEIVQKIEHLISSPEDYRRFSRNGIEFSDRYSWDESYSKNVLRLLGI